MQRLLNRTSPLSLGVILFLIYLANGTFSAGRDTAATVFIPVSVIQEGNVTFTATEIPWAFAWVLTRPEGSWVGRIESWDDKVQGVPLREYLRRGQLKWVDHGYYLAPTRRTAPDGQPLFVNGFGVLPGLLEVPVLYPVALLWGRLPEQYEFIWYGSKLVAAICVAASAAVLYALALRLTSRKVALLAAVAYGLCTCVWSVSSQALWQHGPNVLFIVLAMLCCEKALEGDVKYVAWAGFFLALAASSRPTSLAYVAIVGVWALLRLKKAWLFLAGAAPVLALQFFFNWYYFGSPLTTGQNVVGYDIARKTTGSASLFQTPPLAGLANVLFSPSRGLFVFSPFLLFSLPGFYLVWKEPRFRSLRPYFVSGALILSVEIRHWDWWSGYSFGYRHIVDLCPFFILALIPFLERLRQKSIWRPLFACALAWSLAVQVIGVYAYDIYGWNERGGQNIGDPRYRGRLWSWTDSQLVYSLTHWQESHAARVQQAVDTMNRPIYPAPDSLADTAQAALQHEPAAPPRRG